MQPGLGSAVRQLASFGLLASVLSIELPRPGLCLCVQLVDALVAQLRLLSRAACGALSPIAGTPTDLFDDFLRGLAGLGLDGLQHFGQVAVTPARHGQEELKRLLSR